MLKNINTVNKENISTQTYTPLQGSQLQESLIEKKLSNNGVSGLNGLRNTDLIKSALMKPLLEKSTNQENTDFVVKISMVAQFLLSE